MIVQGEDKRINVNVIQTYTNSSGRKVTTPIDLSDYNGYIVFLYSEETNTIIEKYSLIPTTGYVTISVISAVGGVIQLWLDKTITTNCPLGMTYAELKTSRSDADFSLGNYLTIAKFPVDTVVPSVTNTIIPPI